MKSLSDVDLKTARNSTYARVINSKRQLTGARTTT